MISDYGKGSFSGSIYLCKEIYLDTEPDGNDAIIYLGSMIDSDEIFINGISVGKTDFRYPTRKFKLPEGILKKGRNLITVRLVINNNNGGMMREKPYYLSYNGHRINLEGEWFYKIGKKAEEPMPFVLFPPTLPICFYHTVVVPISKMSVKGMLWYQGETNSGDPKNYYEKFVAMVLEWRNLFGWEVPVIFVQLANYREPMNSEDITGWCQLREEQRRCLSLNKVAMAVSLDIGESYDIHPQNKKELGIRLSKATKYLIYHENITHSGPLPIKAKRSGRSAEIRFQYLGNTKTDSKLSNFELAGEDGIYHSAEASGKDDTVIVSSKEVAVPVSVRYAWLDNPRGINFYNEVGLPAASFCMDISEEDEY
jgi:sialate O-acetylesterase